MSDEAEVSSEKPAVDNAYSEATDCPICPMLATDRDDALYEASIRRANAEAASKLCARVMTHAPEPTIEVDASALMGADDGVRYWHLYTCPDDPTLWNHPQSHADEYFPLADVLLGIASAYVDRPAR